MTTAYTSLLGLALPVTGELSGTWGDTVNDSITSLLDTSVAGTTNISTDANVTLTTTTGAANQARQAILLFSGARTAIRTVTAPAQSKIYTVINATTGGFAVTLVGAGPTTGVTIANGARTVVAWNGSDFVEVSSPSSIILPGGTANGVLYLNGSKVVTSGSALTFNGTNLGVGSSDYGNAGSINLSVGVVGTTSGGVQLWSNTTAAHSIQWGDGTTGSDTYRGAIEYSHNGDSMRFYTSATEQMRLTSTGLGIGTSSPAEKLHVNSGTGNVPALFESTDPIAVVQFKDNNSTLFNAVGVQTNSLIFYSGDNINMRLDNSGNLGLGVTPSAWTNFKAIESGYTGNSYYSNTGNTQIGISSNATYNSGWKYTRSSVASATYEQFQGIHAWYNAASGTAGNAITFTQAMTLDASGNLNVGRTTTVNNARFMSAGSSVAYGTEWGDTKYMSQMYFNSEYYVGVMASAATRELRLESNSSDALARITFYTGASGTTSERARIDSSGNLLVGTTSAITSGRQTLSFDGATYNGMVLSESANASNSTYLVFNNGSTVIGSVGRVGSTSAVVYNTTSDYRLKNVIGAVSGAGARIDALEPVEYEWKDGGQRTCGFLAHKFQEVYPSSVTGTKDAVDAEGNPVYQAMQASTSEVIADLVAEIQSLRKRLADAGI